MGLLTSAVRSIRTSVPFVKPLREIIICFAITGWLIYKIPISDEAKAKSLSDRCYKGTAEDGSGPQLKTLVCQRLSVQDNDVETKCVPDCVEQIQEVIKRWCDELNLSLILTTGGTGFSARDVTPEATRPLLDREAPGMMVAMISKSLAVTPMAMLSRPVCGIRNSTLIVNLPGSKKASKECFEFILPALPHALDLLSGSPKVASVHTQMAVESAVDIISNGGTEYTCPHGYKKLHPSEPTQKRTKADFMPVALRPRHSPYSLVPVDKALEIVLQSVSVLPSIETASLQEALGSIIAEDVRAKLPHPPFPASVKDGYAVIAADGAGDREVLAPVAAGEEPSMQVVEGAVSRITTGAPLPPGADAVVQVEDTELLEKSESGMEEKRVRILSTVKPGHDVRPVGCDIGRNEQVLTMGDRLGPSELGLLAAVGVTRVKVTQRPKVAILSTGNEVVNPGEQLRPGQIYDSNRTSLLAAVREQGMVAVDLGVAKDERSSLDSSLSHGLDEADVVVTSGGVSMGEKDLLKPVLEEDFGATLHFGRVFMKPGKPTTFATVERGGKTKLVFALPGNPVSCIVTFYLFVVPALRKMAGWNKPNLSEISVKLSSAVTLDPRPEYHRATLAWNEEGSLPTATSTGSQCSSRLMSMRTASALLQLPPRSEELVRLEEGSVVKALLLETLV